MSTASISSSGRCASSVTMAVISLVIEAIGTTSSGLRAYITLWVCISTTIALPEANSGWVACRAAALSLANARGAKPAPACKASRVRTKTRIFTGITLKWGLELSELYVRVQRLALGLYGGFVTNSVR